MRGAWAGLLFAVAALTAAPAPAGERLGPLPAGEIARSAAGPSDEMIGYLLFDPAPVAPRLPPGVRFLTLAEKAEGWPRLAAYLKAHPDRRAWAWSFYEIIGIRAARYGHVSARVRGGRGGMAVWYPELVRIDGTDPRPRGTQDLALGSWISDPALVAAMRAQGFPAETGAIAFRRTPGRLSVSLRTRHLAISGGCRLEGRPYVPWWGKEPLSYETMWTPAGEGDSFEIVTWAGHRARKCVDPRWRVTGDHPFARAFNDPTLGDPDFYPAEMAYGYVLRSALYRRRH